MTNAIEEAVVVPAAVGFEYRRQIPLPLPLPLPGNFSAADSSPRSGRGDRGSAPRGAAPCRSSTLPAAATAPPFAGWPPSAESSPVERKRGRERGRFSHITALNDPPAS